MESIICERCGVSKPLIGKFWKIKSDTEIEHLPKICKDCLGIQNRIIYDFLESLPINKLSGSYARDMVRIKRAAKKQDDDEVRAGLEKEPRCLNCGVKTQYLSFCSTECFRIFKNDNSILELRKINKGQHKIKGGRNTCVTCGEVYLGVGRGDKTSYCSRLCYYDSVLFRNLLKKYYALNKEKNIQLGDLVYDETEVKECIICRRVLTKTIENFPKCLYSEDGLSCRCNTCIKRKIRPRVIRRNGESILKEQNGLCYYCGNNLGSWDIYPHEFDFDHKIPLSRGGGNNIENLCCTCVSCNRGENGKHVMTDLEYIEYRVKNGLAINKERVNGKM